MFLKTGLQCVGTSHSIRIMKGPNPFITFSPRSADSTIYVVRSLITKDEDVHLVFDTMYEVDFDIMHRQLAHPSKEVLQKARKHLKEFQRLSSQKRNTSVLDACRER